jgi:hypothetical protein
VAIAVVAATAIAGIVPITAASAAPRSPRAKASATLAGSVNDGSLSDADQALADAIASGQPVEVVSARTELSDEWANPDGTFSVKRYGSPVRMWRNGAWVPTDATLIFAADGSVVPTATTVAVTFSGGGTGPLLTGVKDGRTLSLSWPVALPTPTLSGNVATYSEILPGVDLQLKAEVEGFSQLVVVKTLEAAQNPQLTTLRYTMSTVGLSVSTDTDTGSIAALDPAGQTVFTSAVPLMWDSSSSGTSGAAAATTTGTSGDVFEPPPGATDAQMATSVSGDTLTITPDQALLTAPTTTYPVYIDPSWAWGVRQDWTRVYKKYPNTSYWNANEVARVGYENETYGLSRSFFQWDVSNVKNASVISSTFRIRNVWSWSCQARPVQVWQTGPISAKTTWNNQPAKVGTSPLATVDDAKGWSSDLCPAGNLEFDLTSKIRDAAAHNYSSITLGLYASDETDTFGWKKFDPKTAALETQFNYPPKIPYNLGTNPSTSCANGGLIGNTIISLYATVADPDAGNLTAQFQLFTSGSTTPVADQSLTVSNGRVATLVLPDTLTPSNAYTWKVRAKDNQSVYSAWSATCKFSVDRTRPGRPPIINSTAYPNGDAGWPANTGSARVAGDFTLAANGVTDVVKYYWYTDYDPSLRVAPVATGATATVPVTPPSAGPHLVYAYSVDPSGNRSDTATYLYYAKGSYERDIPHDLNGDGYNDVWSIDSNGTLLTYAGKGNGQFAATTNGGQAFTDAQVTSSGDWGQDGYNDLVTIEPDPYSPNKQLWAYPNNGNGIATVDGIDGSKQQLWVTCPVKVDPWVDPENPDGCKVGYDHWHDADQILAPGDIIGTDSPDLLVKEPVTGGAQLWAYCGDRASKQLNRGCGEPLLIGGTDWNRYTVIAPGDLNGNGVADLLLREDSTGDVYRIYGAQDPNTRKLDPASWGESANRVKIATGAYPKATYPVIGSSGDLTSDGIADLWARKTDNTMLGWPGQTTGTELTGFGTVFTVDGITGGAHIPTGTTITSGQTISSRSAKLTMGTDGNLTITSNTGATLWSTATTNHPGAKALMQTDGNLVVLDANGTTTLWSSNTPLTGGGYALLQDRGNLAVYNAKGQSQWSSGTHIRHDYNGNGRSDMAAWYDYADGSSGLVTFFGQSDGTVATPLKSYQSQVGSWNSTKMQWVTGDYNGDGRGDMAAVYDYGNGVVKFFTALGRADGGFDDPVPSYTSNPGGWYLPSMTLHSGDFNGDGRDDLAVWYAYASGQDTLFTFTANVQGGFNPPFASWTNTQNDWNVDQMKFVTGDFNGDGRDDLGALYGYSDGHVTMFSWLTTATGGFPTSMSSWTSTTWDDWHRTYLQAGDFNGDGKDDVSFWYDYADGHDALFTLTAKSNGGFNSPIQSWQSAAGNFDYNHMKMISGDYNGDGRDDLAAMYGYTDGTNTTRTFSWLGTSTGGFAGSYPGWSSTTWTWSRFHFLNRYN